MISSHTEYSYSTQESLSISHSQYVVWRNGGICPGPDQSDPSSDIGHKQATNLFSTVMYDSSLHIVTNVIEGLSYDHWH